MSDRLPYITTQKSFDGVRVLPAGSLVHLLPHEVTPTLHQPFPDEVVEVEDASAPSAAALPAGPLTDGDLARLAELRVFGRILTDAELAERDALLARKPEPQSEPNRTERFLVDLPTTIRDRNVLLSLSDAAEPAALPAPEPETS